MERSSGLMGVPARPIPATTRELAPLNPHIQKRLHEAAMLECQAALEEFEALRGQWLEYEEQDQPAYFRWLHAQFGPALQQIREVFEKISEKRGIIDAVEDLAEEMHCEYGEAYEEFQARRERGEQEEFAFDHEREREAPDPDEDGLEGFDRPQGDPNARGPGSSRARGRSEEEEARAWGANARPDDREAPPAERQRSMGPSLDPARLSELKSLYRSLARKLHPDVSRIPAALKERAQALWHQIQEAYDQRDLGRLGTLAALADSLTGKGPKSGAAPERPGSRIHDLMATARRYRRSARELWRQIERARQDPAFGFHRVSQAPESASKSKQLAAAKRRARIELEFELDEAQEALTSLERFIESWDRPARRARAERESRSGRRGRGRARKGQGR